MPEFCEPLTYPLPVLSRNKRGQVVVLHATVLDDTFTDDVLRSYSWHLNENGYPRSQENGVFKYLHQIVFCHYHGPCPDKAVIDHKDANKLNAIPENLRPLSHADNVRNGCYRIGQSGYRGVSRASNGSRGKWRAYFRLDGKQFHLGFFDTAEDAARVVNAAFQERFPHLNIPNPNVVT